MARSSVNCVPLLLPVSKHVALAPGLQLHPVFLNRCAELFAFALHKAAAFVHADADKVPASADIT